MRGTFRPPPGPLLPGGLAALRAAAAPGQRPLRGSAGRVPWRSPPRFAGSAYRAGPRPLLGRLLPPGVLAAGRAAARPGSGPGRSGGCSGRPGVAAGSVPVALRPLRAPAAARPGSPPPGPPSRRRPPRAAASALLPWAPAALRLPSQLPPGGLWRGCAPLSQAPGPPASLGFGLRRCGGAAPDRRQLSRVRPSRSRPLTAATAPALLVTKGAMPPRGRHNAPDRSGGG